MTPKEKAQELVGRHACTPINFPYIDTQDGQCIGSGYLTHASSKLFALIAVDEVLKMHDEYKSLSDEGPLDFMGTGSVASMNLEIKEYEKDWDSKKLFWRQVKIEIEQL